MSGAELHIEELHQTNSMLAPLENEFSRVLSEAARSTVLMPLIVMFATAAIMPGVTFTLPRRLLRNNETVQAALGSRKSEDFYVQREDRDRLIQTLHRDSSARDREIQLQDTQGNKFWILMSSQRISYQGESGSIVPLGWWVLESACAQLHRHCAAAVAAGNYRRRHDARARHHRGHPRGASHA